MLPINQKLLWFLLILWVPGMLSAQNNELPEAEIEITIDKKYENVYTFEVINEPPLDQIAGAPEAFYEYFWEFGDGSYSFEEKPTYAYDDFGNGDVLVALTNNYSNGGAPPTRPKKKRKRKDQPKPNTNSTAVASNWQTPDGINTALEANASLGMITNHNPRPKDPLVAILSYGNNGLIGTLPNEPQSGRLYLFYNEKSFNYQNFQFTAAREHAGEILVESIPTEQMAWKQESYSNQLLASTDAQAELKVDLSTLSGQHKDLVLFEAKEQYNNVLSWEFEDLQPDEARNIFVSLNTSAEMIRDTASTITFKAVMVPHNSVIAETHTMALTVLASHDPNKMEVSDRRINKEVIKNQGLTYTIKFQNTGRGPATNIMIENKIHKSLDPSTIQILEIYPQTEWCHNFDVSAVTSCHDTLVADGMITWKLNNIYLPGRRQEDRESKEATKGWIKYTIKPKKRLRGRRLKSRSYIYFDRNEPITTNQVRTTVEKNKSIGIKGGLHNIDQDFDHLFGGITWSNFRPKWLYHQGELMVTQEGFAISDSQLDIALGTDAAGNTLFGDQFTDYSYSLLFIDLVPLSIRKNFLGLISVGVGAQISLLAKAEEETVIRRVYDQTGIADENIMTNTDVVNIFDGLSDDRFSTIEPGAFIDVSVGRIVNGPSVGARMIWKNNKRPNGRLSEEVEAEIRSYLQVYLLYKL